MDYGPFGFLDQYDPSFCEMGRQPATTSPSPINPVPLWRTGAL